MMYMVVETTTRVTFLASFGILERVSELGSPGSPQEDEHPSILETLVKYWSRSERPLFGDT